jgi:hypothetical protein
MLICYEPQRSFENIGRRHSMEHKNEKYQR